MPPVSALSALAALSLASAALLPAAPVARAPTPCPGQVRRPPPAPSAPPWPSQRYPESLNALADGHGIVVAVIDSGVDGASPQLRGAVVPGPDQLDGTGSLVDCVGHGTGVAGIIAARPAAGSPMRGLAPAATILALRVTELTEGEDGTSTGRRGTPDGLATAIHDAVARHARVINLSLVTYSDTPAIREAVAFALSSGVVMVAAVGNGAEQGNPTPYPAAYDGVIGVGAITPDNTRVPTSQSGPYVDLVAPGAQIVTTATPSGLTTMDGTSFAAPFVSATAALLLQYRPDLSPTQIATQLKATADGSGQGDGYGAGVLNPYRALTEHLGAPPSPSERAALPPLKPVPDAPQRTAARDRTLLLASVALSALLLGLLLAATLPRAHRRHWRPGVRERP